jgi:suppressor for copper-sensitivity B
LPYLAVAAFPALAARLPRPGRWMLTLRRILALLLAATALWLLSVLAGEAGLAAAGLVLAALAAAALILHFGRPAAPRRAGVAASLLVAFALPWLLPVPAPTGVAEAAGWRRFDPAAIDRLVRQGRVVFVDVTADWCLNCKLNERLVLDHGGVASRLARADVVAMRADWTRPDPAIAGFLRRYGRYGIPFYAVYGPGAPEGRPLGEILTEGTVLSAVEAAAAPGAAGAKEGG